MNPELAALLDGPVAERFGRLAWGPFAHPITLQGTATYWWEYEWGNGNRVRLPDDVAEALWLAHLLGVCGEWTTEVLICQHCAGCLVRVGYSESNAPTMLEALARAMLAVPEKP